MRIVTTITPTSTNNKTMKVRMLKEGGFCVFVFLGRGGGGGGGVG